MAKMTSMVQGANLSLKVESFWSEFSLRTDRGSGLQHRRVSNASERALFAGYRLPEGKPTFTLRVRKGALPSFSALPKLGGVELIGSVEGNSVYFGLMLRDANNLDLFETFCRDLIRHVAPCSSDKSAVDAFLARLQGWQKFLERGGIGLSSEAERGLWGELFFLREHLWPLLQQESIELWRGPLSSPQDFQCQSSAVEVKTITPTSPFVKINSEKQLDGVGLSHLFLYCLRIQEEENGESLPQMIESLRVQSSEEGRKRLDDLLLEVGYFDAHAQEYNSHLFSPIGQVLFTVEEGFPCLTSSTVSSGLSRIVYNLDLGSCSPFQCDFSALRCLLPPTSL